MKEEEGEKIGL